MKMCVSGRWLDKPQTIKESRFGREGASSAVDEMIELKMVVFHLSS